MKFESLYYLSEDNLQLVLIPRKISPDISFQVFYSKGSKNETDSHRGIAHMLEHMIFKGTKKLPEGSLDKIIYKLSGSTNAFTSYDYTGYTFDVPSCNYESVLKLINEFMNNPSFKQEYLNSELKAVFQELKMYKDDNLSFLIEKIMSSLFSDHPYSNPIIGYKNIIANFKRKDLVNFFKKFYKSENITLVVSGNFEEKEFIKNAEKLLFKKFKKVENFENKINKNKLFHQKELLSSEIEIKRDVEVPHFLIAWEMPGIDEKSSFIYDAFSIFFGSGRGSFLYKKLVQELELTNDIDSFSYDLFEYSVFFIYIQPKKIEFIEKIKEEIYKILKIIIEKDYSDEYLTRAINKTKMAYVNIFEDNSKLAYTSGKFILSAGKNHDINFLFNLKKKELKDIFSNLCKDNFNKILSINAKIIPFENEDEKEVWKKIQEKIDFEDNELLKDVPIRKVFKKKEFDFDVIAKKPHPCELPKFERYDFSNNSTLYSVYLDEIDKIDICIDFKSKHYLDEKKHEGRMSFLFDLMEEGTKKYSGNKFGEHLEKFGMDFETTPGSISLSCLPDDLEEAFKILKEYIFYPEFSENSFNRIKEQRISDILCFLDDSSCVAKQKIKELIYKDHPYGKNPSGSVESNKKLKLNEIKEAFEDFIIPDSTVFIVCGKVKPEIVKNLFQKYFDAWSGKKALSILKNEPIQIEKFEKIHHKMNRDQSVIIYGGLSTKRFDDKYNPLLVFDQIFAGGISGNMNSKLFSLREKNGFFYSISGSVISGCSEHSGMLLIKAITSKDLVEKSIKLINKKISEKLDYITEEEISDAKKIIQYHFFDLVSSYKSIASTILFMHRYNLNEDFLKLRFSEIENVKEDDIEKSVKQVLDLNKLICLTVGR